MRLCLDSLIGLGAGSGGGEVGDIAPKAAKIRSLASENVLAITIAF